MRAMKKTFQRSMMVGALLAAAACGGGGGGPSSSEDVATTAGGEAITTVGGVVVTVTAHNHWKAGIEAFERHEKDGWSAQACSDTRDIFEKALKAQRGKFVEAEYMIGLTYERCGDRSKAKSIYEKVIEAHPKMCSPRVALGLIKEEVEGDEKGALAFYQEAIRQNPNCPAAYVNIARHQAKGNADEVYEAVLNLRRALAFRSDYLPAFNELALIHFKRGKSRDQRSELDLAEIVLRQAQLIDESYAPIYNTWGLVKLERGDLLAALQFFEQARKLDPNIFEAQMNFGQITLSFRGYRDAREAFAQAVKLRPDDYDAVVGLGAALRGLEQYDEAEKQYKRAIELDSDRPDAYFNMAILLHEYLSAQADSQERTVERLKEADRWYDTFVEKAKNNRAYAANVDDVTRRCNLDRKKRRGSTECQMGRKQVIEEFITALREAEEMQREMEEMERMMREQEAAAEAEASEG